MQDFIFFLQSTADNRQTLARAAATTCRKRPGKRFPPTQTARLDKSLARQFSEYSNTCKIKKLSFISKENVFLEKYVLHSSVNMI